MDVVDEALVRRMCQLIKEPSDAERIVPCTLHQDKELIDDW